MIRKTTIWTLAALTGAAVLLSLITWSGCGVAVVAKSGSLDVSLFFPSEPPVDTAQSASVPSGQEPRVLYLWVLWVAVHHRPVIYAPTQTDTGLDAQGREWEHVFSVGVSFWFLAIVLGVYPTIAIITLWCIRRRRARLVRVGLCGSCGYDLTGNVSGVCPECGRSVQLAEPSCCEQAR